MATDVILPRVDMDMTTGRISHWYVKAGETVEKGSVLFEIETDKAAMEIDAPASGRVQIVVPVGAQVPVGSTVGWILGDGESEVTDVVPSTEAKAPAEAVAEAAVAVTIAASAAESTPATGDVRATPLSRRIAAQHGIDLATVAGSGPKGRIQADDVEALVRKIPAAAVASGGLLNGTWLRQSSSGQTIGEPLIMIHGFGSDLGGWRPFVGALPADLPIYALDLPGHGGSPLRDVAGIDDIVAQVIASLKAAGISGGHLVGHSLGGGVAALVASSGQFAAKSLFLLAPGGLGPEINAGFIQGFASAASEAALGVWMQELVEDPAVMTPALVKATTKLRVGTALPQTQGKVADLLFTGGAQGFSILAALRDPAVPTRVIFGRADRIIPASHANRLTGLVGVHLFANVGHLPHYEAREAVAALLLQHLKSAG